MIEIFVTMCIDRLFNVMMISVRRGPFRDAFLLFTGLLVGGGIVLYFPDSSDGPGPLTASIQIEALGVKALQQAQARLELARRIKDRSVHINESSLANDRERLPVTKVRPKTIAKELMVRKTLFVGVVTAQKFLETRGKAIYETWGKSTPMIQFFSAEGKSKGTLPVVSLPGVDDTYPPQKKVYRMLKYMHDKYIDEYDWFLRADDDVYVRIPKLMEFLNTLDPTKMIYMGQPGMGKPQDLERIKLRSDEHYCMGGPGVIFSNTLLRRLAPHLEECLSNVVVSYNEDLEVGRCISRRLDVQCTWSYEVR